MGGERRVRWNRGGEEEVGVGEEENLVVDSVSCVWFVQSYLVEWALWCRYVQALDRLFPVWVERCWSSLS